jgi:hypothetical protein
MKKNIVKKDDTNIPSIVYRTDYDKEFAPTDFEKGMIYYTCDGKPAVSIDRVMEYNQIYYENMMIKEQDNQIYCENIMIKEQDNINDKISVKR